MCNSVRIMHFERILKSTGSQAIRFTLAVDQIQNVRISSGSNISRCWDQRRARGGGKCETKSRVHGGGKRGSLWPLAKVGDTSLNCGSI